MRITIVKVRKQGDRRYHNYKKRLLIVNKEHPIFMKWFNEMMHED